MASRGLAETWTRRGNTPRPSRVIYSKRSSTYTHSHKIMSDDSESDGQSSYEARGGATRAQLASLNSDKPSGLCW